LAALGAGTWDWLVVDHYALDHRFETPLRKVCKHIMAIDDLADRVHDCDVLLDQNFYQNKDQRYLGKVPAHCRLLLGPSFALLRLAFKEMRHQVKARTGKVKTLLVFFGGVDADNLTGQVLDVLISLNLAVQVNVVIGQLHPQKEKIRQLCEQHNYNCHVQTNQMASLMAEADLAIGAGGSATWERCALGLPTIVIVTAHHQVKAAKDLSEIGISNYLGYVTEVNFKKIEINIVKAINDNLFINETSVKSFKLVDGNGASKILTNRRK
jgi:UDP-2,4-diacetamido-2,4,6-trideoxy-beta-L-altropyranose hydrolase